jgi:hypothetical protein
MIPIFKYEAEAGLAELIRSTGSITYASAITTVDINDDETKKLMDMLETSAEANPNQFDLFYLESILASVGWNANTDVFAADEIWAARNTPIDKQFNYMHDETDIIGHLTSAKIVDFEGKVIASKEDLPDKFDIVTGAVLYRNWTDPDLQARMNKIIAEIKENKWCVSMECLFSNFDYAVITPAGEHKVIARNEESSFLTKHLRMYGGTGEFQGHQIGRLLRGFTFSGKGLVDNPANKRSTITITDDKQETSSFAGAAATVEELGFSSKLQENLMTISQEQYDALKAQYDALKADLEKQNASKAAEAKKELDESQARIAELEEVVAKLQSDLDSGAEIAKAKDENVESLKADLEKAQKELSEANDKLAAQELEALKAARKAMLLEKVDDDRASALVEKFQSADDEMFAALVESLPAKKMEDKEDDTEEDAKKKCKSEEDSEEDSEAQTDIDDAKASEDADMASGGDDVPEPIRSKAAKWFENGVFRTTAKNKGE